MRFEQLGRRAHQWLQRRPLPRDQEMSGGHQGLRADRRGRHRPGWAAQERPV